MVKVKLADIDKLHSLANDISVLTYILQLLRENTGGRLISDDGNTHGSECIVDYVIDRQVETVIKIWELLDYMEILCCPMIFVYLNRVGTGVLDGPFAGNIEI